MMEPILTADEPIRLGHLHATGLLDSPLENRFERITRMACRLLGCPIAAVSLIDARRQFFKSAQGLDVSETSRGVSFCGHTILGDDVMVVQDARRDPRFHDNPLVLGEPSIVFYAGCPIRSREGAKIGSLCVIAPTPRVLNAEDRALLRDLAALASMEIAASAGLAMQDDLMGQVREMSHAARVDPLTRIWSREAILDIAAERMPRASGLFGLLVIDVDDLRRVNEEHGYRAGDLVLRRVAQRVLAAAGDNDAVGRLDGEEFLLVPSAVDGLAGAVRLAERVRTEVAASPVRASGADLAVTVSVGVAVGPRDGGVEGLLRSAEAAVVAAKGSGWNRVHAATASGPGTAAA